MRFFFLHITIINYVVYYMYVCDAQKARAVAVAGYLWVLKHHRSVNLVDYIMRTVHHRQQEGGVVVDKRGGTINATYDDTGLSLIIVVPSSMYSTVLLHAIP
jgi:hypothetical protein